MEETIKEDWFQQAIHEKTDLFVVIGHVGVHMEEFKAIFQAIRKQNWFTPIAFFGGHVHVRDATSYDDKSFALASGRYFETIGFMSINGLAKKETEIEAQSVSFNRRYIDNKPLLVSTTTPGSTRLRFQPSNGRNGRVRSPGPAQNLISTTPTAAPPQDYLDDEDAVPGKDSIYTWFSKSKSSRTSCGEQKAQGHSPCSPS